MDENIGYANDYFMQLSDDCAWLMAYAPKFQNSVGYFPNRNVNTVFIELNRLIEKISIHLSGDTYAKMRDMSDRMRMHFEADPEGKTDEYLAGLQLIRDFEELLNESARALRGRGITILGSQV